MNANKKLNNKLNNRGLSLVELIVAISIGVIVSGSIAALMTFAIRMYRNESANVSAQYELQTNVNQIVDTIMGANCYVIKSADSPSPAGRLTDYAAFGSFDGSSFSGVVFVPGPEDPADSDRFNIYMDRGTWPGTSAYAAVITHVGTINASIGAVPNPYFLGEGSTLFCVEPKILTESPKTYVNITSDGYRNPLSVEVELYFQKDATGKVVDKHVKDEVLIRNKVSADIYINGTPYSLKD